MHGAPHLIPCGPRRREGRYHQSIFTSLLGLRLGGSLIRNALFQMLIFPTTTSHHLLLVGGSGGGGDKSSQKD